MKNVNEQTLEIRSIYSFIGLKPITDFETRFAVRSMYMTNNIEDSIKLYLIRSIDNELAR